MAERQAAQSLDFETPETVSKYRIIEMLGKGTCGRVYKAYDPSLQRVVAIKLSPAASQVQVINQNKFPASHRAFLNETAAAGRLHHPNIVTLFDAGRENDLNFLVMEYVEGETLKHYGKGGRDLLPASRVIEIMLMCLRALAYSHARGVIHRDIKPSNIMMTADGEVKLLDFGIAVPIARAQNATGKPSLGTPNYMAPEQILGRPLGPQCDLYALGTVMYEMLTGARLFKASKVKELFRKVLKDPAPRLMKTRPDLPHNLSEVTAKALEKDPALRYQSANEFAAALTRVMLEMDPQCSGFVGQRIDMTFLRQQPFFQGLSEFDLAELLQNCETVALQRHEVLLAEEEEEKHLYLIASGELLAQQAGQFVELLGPGDCIGNFVFAGPSYSAVEVVAMDQAVVYRVDSAFFDALSAGAQIRYYKAFSRLLAQRTAGLHQPRVDFALTAV